MKFSFAGVVSVCASSLVPRQVLPGVVLALSIFGVAVLSISAKAQLAGTGAIAGTVQDPAGAVVANATVTATNVATNVAVARTTTKSGDFNITPLLPGTYTVTVAASGFQGYKQENIAVDALNTVEVNAHLSVGQASETVTVTTAPPLLQTQDATLGGVMDNEMYSNLPLQMGASGKTDQRRATDFEYLMPGVQGNYTNGDPTDNSGIVNGSGPKGGVSEVYIDGINLPEADAVGDPRFTWTAIGVDSIDQFQVQTAGVSSQYSGQGVENYSIKSGGNAYHGSLYEYNRNSVFDAWAFNAKTPTLNGQGNIVTGGIKPREVQNEFGIVLQGPIVKNKLFLFGNYGQYRYQRGATYTSMTLPTAAMLGYTPSGQPLGYADFSGYAAQYGAHIYDPATQVAGCATCSRQIFTAMKNGVPTDDLIPANRISPASAYYNKFLLPYQPLVNQTAYDHNLAYGTPVGLANWYATGRIDYTQSSRNQLGLIIAFGRQAATGKNSSSGLNPPFNASQIYNPVTTVDILKDTFTINAHLINQFAIGFGRYQSDSTTPNWQKQYAATTAGILNMPAGQAAGGFPGISWSGSFGNPATWGGYAFNNKINNTYTVTDTLQWVHGRHNFNFGGQLVKMEFNYDKVVSPSGPMAIQFSSTQTSYFTSGSKTDSGSGSAVASYMIGAANSGSTSANVPGLGSRWLDPSFWAEDDYKVNDRLTLNLGLRLDIYPSIHEAHNIFTFLNPNGMNSITGNKGTLMFAGNGDPALYCNCKSPSPISWKNWSPRLGFAYSVNPKTVVRGSYNVNVARGNWTDGSQSGSPSTLGVTPSASAPSGISSAPAFYWDGAPCSTPLADSPTGLANDDVDCGWTGSVIAPAPPAGGTSLAEYATTNTSVLKTGGGATMTYWDPYRGSRTPQYINWTFGIQRQLTHDMSITISYVGSQGHFINGGLNKPEFSNRLTTNFAALAGYNLNGSTATPCDANHCGFGSGNTDLLGSKATASAISAVEAVGFKPPNPYTSATYYASNSVTGYFVAFPQFKSVSDTTNFNGNTNFHALEISLRQRAAHGLDLMVNYTYSKAMDDLGGFRLNDNARLDRSLSVTDQPQNLNATAVYQLPFGRGRAFGADNRLVSALAGGWRLSGIFSYHSGTPLSLSGSGCGGAPLGTCMPSLVPGVKARIGKYGSNVVADPSAPNYYAKTSYLNGAAFSVNQAGADPSIPCTGTAVTSVCNGATPINRVGQQNLNTKNGVINYVGNGTALYVPGSAPRVGGDNVWSMSAYNVDLGLKRTFPVWEQVSLQFEADMLNATNHVVWGSLNGGVGGSSLGYVGLGNAPRDMQFAARLNW